jgi:uncharacterized membrane protein YfcA
VPSLDPIWLLLAGFGGGLSGSVAGLASLVSYPALLAVGVPPISANVTNTVSLVFSSAGSVWGSRPELKGQGARARGLAPVAVAGGASGGALLLLTPASDFSRLVPILIGVASLAILVPRRAPQATPDDTERCRPTLPLAAAIFVVSAYGGYFGAAAGVIMLATLLLATAQPLARANALKNLLLGMANAVAAVAFAVFGPVRWWDVLPLAVGFLAGGRLGPIVVRRVPAWPLRIMIALCGVGLAVHLGLGAYA